MDWNFNITPAKIEELKQRIERLGIDLDLIEEQFVRGSGRGGQKINKTANCVRMSYPPLNIQVKVQRSRERNQNRFLALRELVDRAEMLLSPETSARRQAIEKKRKQKQRRRRRSAAGEGD
jgi:peptide chain release factor